MARVKNVKSYSKKLKDDFRIVQHKLIVNSYLLSDSERSNLIDCLTQLENYLEDEMQELAKEKELRQRKNS